MLTEAAYEALFDPDERISFWAAQALDFFDTKAARKALWEAGSMKLATPAETEQFQQMPADLGRWKK